MQVPSEATTEPTSTSMSALKQVSSTEPAPTIRLHIRTVNGSTITSVLPDSGADISAAGLQILTLLDEHQPNLLHSTMSPHTASGHQMTPIGKLPTTFVLQGRQHREDMHIFPEVKGVMISWKACKALGILPHCYPVPQPLPQVAVNPPTPSAKVSVNATAAQPISVMDQLMTAFPMVFDGQIRVVQGEEFHIDISDTAKPFCVHTPRTIPFAYRDKLQAELNLLEAQSIITPVINRYIIRERDTNHPPQLKLLLTLQQVKPRYSQCSMH